MRFLQIVSIIAATVLSILFFSCLSSQPKPELSKKPKMFSEELLSFANVYWTQKCSACHGTSGIPPEGLLPIPRKFGTFGMKMGFFFGGDKMRAGIFRTIRDGKNRSMPSFGKELSEEQLWALVNKIERLPD
ncbi:cytochrome C oxidase, Cbb3-type, subunit III [Leptospira fainei serovar Hurstbridge str. BUT 6]|uniref:Cytochrome C oxidase, Cbb3-type, subunit III n=1 Tax=Leptospira fainei serovar Hurstbridge str. BUT 6 TaxID=1193011 RepID=S3VZA0_9LEPT|nr:cytochrome c [Leptospira fainei]EPG73412.1 cytochrome C oxidase, Cbb3-type, subunit III [Leptospira fainei serovar Hurstbridge str. BUT 6]